MSWLPTRIETRATDLGSIGVVGIFRAGAQNAIEIVSSNAPDKRPDATTPEGKRVLQAQIDDLETVFIDSLSGLRPRLTANHIKALRGGVEIGAKAVNAGLADGLGSLQSVLDGKPGIKPDIRTSGAQAAGDWGKAMARACGRTDSSRKDGNNALPLAIPDCYAGSADRDRMLPAAPHADQGWKAAFAKVGR